MEERPRVARCLAEAFPATLGFALFAIILMAPLFSDLGNSTLDANREWVVDYSSSFREAMQRDVYLHAWIYAWDWHALTTDPLRLFQANIFHPAPSALAYSDHALGKVLFAGPLYALSGNPIFAAQADLLLSFALGAGVLYYALRRLGLHPAAAVLSGFVYAFGPARIDNIYQTQLLAGQFLPLILLALDRTLTQARARTAVWLALLVLLQLLCSYYVAYMTAIGLAVYTLAAVAAGRATISARGVALTAGAGAAALALFVVPSLPYLLARKSGAVLSYDAAVGTGGLAGLSNGAWRNYLVPLHAIRAGWARAETGSYAYLGLVPMALALYGTVRRNLSAPTRRLRAGALALTITAWLMALGPRLPIGDGVPGPYAVAMWVIPGFSSMRAPARFALMVLTGLALLAGVGADGLFRRPRLAAHPARATAAAALLLGLVAIDYGYGTERYDTRPFEHPGNTPDVYLALARLPPGPVVELPFTDRVGLRASEYMVRSTLHWNPLLNGVSGYGPPSQGFVQRLVGRLPAPPALELLGRMTGLRYVIVHDARSTRARSASWRHPAGLELVGTFGSDRLYRVVDPPPADLLPEVAACAAANEGCDALRTLVRETLTPNRRRRRARAPIGRRPPYSLVMRKSGFISKLL